ncbi:MAG TPA: hypothetical protein PKK06_10585 [Phycisphaerae bacterium]|nr:hypothetical protein [Phycisphaerae bacterium]HNU44985.1 hypothetical protein [Phycisphaerae bacterium]
MTRELHERGGLRLVGREALCSAGVVLAAIGAGSPCSSRRVEEKIRGLRRVPMRLRADLATSGRYRGAGERVSLPPGKRLLCIEPTGEGAPALPRELTLTELVAAVTLAKRSGEAVNEQQYGAGLSNIARYSVEGGGTYSALRMPGLRVPIGVYDCEFRVVTGVPALTGHKHQLVARCDVCLLPALSLTLLVVSLLSGLGFCGLVAIGVWLAARGARQCRRPTPGPVETPCD